MCAARIDLGSRVASVALLAFLAALLAIHAGDPWRYLHDDNGRRYSSYARTHLALGLARTRGLDFFYDPHDGRLVPYGHHPPTLGLLLAGWFFATGYDGPRAARTLAAIFHLVSAALVIGLLRKHYPGPPGLIAAVAFAVVPMSAFLGKMVNFEPFVLPFLIGGVVSYWHWTEGGGPGWIGLAALLLAAGTLIDWPALLAVPVVAADSARRWRRNEGRVYLGAGLGACVLGIAIGGVVAAWAGAAVNKSDLTAALGYRLSLHGDYAWWRLVGKLVDYNRRYFTEPVLIASVAATAILVRDWWRSVSFSPRARLLTLLGAAGILPVILFPSSARYHAYWQFYLLPYATLALADTLERAGACIARRPRMLLYTGVVVWIATASAITLHYRYTNPSGYVAKTVRELEPYL
jgi:4-amino-4-deoxy-L-arabinose transferase-like glycosyltransferase